MKVAILFSHGFEEIEAIAPLDIWRRAGYEVEMVYLQDPQTVSARGLKVLCERSFAEVEAASFDLVFLPGGAGVEGMLEHEALGPWLHKMKKEGTLIAAICAAPKVLVKKGLVQEEIMTSFPGVRSEIVESGISYSEERVVESGLLWTSRGAGSSEEFALQIVAKLSGEKTADELFEKMQYRGSWKS